jgi:hypothetical protein
VRQMNCGRDLGNAAIGCYAEGGVMSWKCAVGEQGILRALLLMATAALVGCAQLPSPSKVKAFSQATSAASDVIKTGIDVNSDLALHEGEDIAARKFLLGSPYDLPPAGTLKLDERATKPRIELIAAIGKYAQSLGAAADGTSIQDLQASATALATTVGQDIAPLLGTAAVPLVSPLAKIVGLGVGASVASSEAAEIRVIMERTHPILVSATDELKVSLAVILRNDKRHLRNWQTQKRSLLDQLQRQSPANAGAALAEFRAASTQARDYAARIDALSKYPRLLDAMVKAHEGLINPTERSETDLAQFLSLVQQLAGILSAVKSAV